MPLILNVLMALSVIQLLYCDNTVAEDELDTSVFGLPLLFPYGNCSAASTPQSYSLHFTSLLNYSTDIEVLQIGPHYGLFESFPQAIHEVTAIKLIEPNSIAGLYKTCQRYYCKQMPTQDVLEQSNGTCNHTEMVVAFYTNIESNPVILVTVNQKGPDFMHVYPTLPRHQFEEPKRKGNYEYRIPIGSSKAHHTCGIAIMAVQKCTNVTITSTANVYLYTISNASITIDSVDANTTVFFNCLEFFQILWLEEIVANCSYSSSLSELSGTVITSSPDIATYTAQVQCNETQSIWENGTSPLNFSFVANTVQHIPQTEKWGKTFVIDLSHLKTLNLNPSEVSLYIQSSNTTADVSITTYLQHKKMVSIQRNIQVGKPLQINIDEYRNATNVIIHSTHPVLVLYEAHPILKTGPYLSTLVQPVEWFTHKQSALLSHSLSPQNESYHIALVTPNDHYQPNTILVADQEHYPNPVPIEDYEYFEYYTTYSTEQYTVFQLYVNSSTFNTSDKTLVFKYSSSQPCGKLGATVFAYGQRNGYAYSNGYVLDDSTLTKGISCKQTLSVYAIIGSIGGILMLATIVVTCVTLRLCRVHGLAQPDPPVNGFEFDAFLSFADEDKEFVTSYLYNPLKRKGYLVFWHHSDFIPGLTINENILRAIQASRRIIFVCSEHFHQSDFCQKELKFGVDSHYNQYKGRYRRIVPLVIQEGQCPQELRQLRPIKVDMRKTSMSGYQELVTKLNFGKPIEKCKQKKIRNRKKLFKRKKENTNTEEDTISLLSEMPGNGDPV